MALGITMAWHDHFFSPDGARWRNSDDDVSGRFDACETEDGEFLVYSAEDDAIVIRALPSRLSAIATAEYHAKNYQSLSERWDDLLAAWRRYQSAISAMVVYGTSESRDRTQALGMAFCYLWKRDKAVIAARLDAEYADYAADLIKRSGTETTIDALDYQKAREVMARFF